MDETIRPKWRNSAAFASSVNSDAVQEEIAEYMSKASKPGRAKGDKARALKMKNEALAKLPGLLKDLRYVDLRSIPYWSWLFVLTFIFVVLEHLLVCVFLGLHSAVYLNLSFALLCVIVIVGLFLFLTIYQFGDTKLASRIVRLSTPGFFHAVPVIILTVGFILHQAMVIEATGGIASPFMPAFFTSGLVILGLPRENSKTVGILSLLVVSVVILVYCNWWQRSNIAGTSQQSFEKLLNIAAFVFAAISIYVLRRVSTKCFTK